MRSKEPEFSLRLARPSDYDFAAGLYLDGMKRLLSALGTWDEDRLRTHFAGIFKLEEAQVICSDANDIGWMQLSESADGVYLVQLHLVDAYRNRGIGTRLVQTLLDHAVKTDKSVGLDVVRGNAAISLYQRLGFQIVSEGDEKLKIRSSDGPGPIRPGGVAT
jgi:ribosomal protein S18 acetylase RimI-like enzyme